MRVLSLCSGIGGLDLAAEWAGFQIVGQIENNPFCQIILKQHFSRIPLLSDLKEVSTYEKEELEDIFGRVDFLMGGIPCQPFSSVGKRRGVQDDRHLWPYALALIEKLQPAWVLIENVRNFTTLALDLVLFDLESLHYETQAFVFPACATGAPHIRERCFILAYSNSNRQWQRAIQYERRGESTPTPNACDDGQKRYVEDSIGQRYSLSFTGQFSAESKSSGTSGSIALSNPDRQSLAVGQCESEHTRSQFQATERVHNRTAGGRARNSIPNGWKHSWDFHQVGHCPLASRTRPARRVGTTAHD